MRVKLTAVIKFEKELEIPDEDLEYQSPEEWLADHE